MILQKVVGCAGILLLLGLVSSLNQPFWLGVFPAILVILTTPRANRERPMRWHFLATLMTVIVVSYVHYVANLGLLDPQAFSLRVWQALAWGLTYGSALNWACAGRHARALPLLSIGAVLVSIFGSESPAVVTREAEIALLSVLGFALVSETVARGTWGPNYRARARLQSVAIILVAITMVGRYTAGLVERSLPGLRVALDASLQDIEIQSITVQRAYFSRSATLRNVTQIMTNDPNTVAISVFSDRRPGYLRGTAFATYRSGEWINGTAANRLTTFRGRPVSEQDPPELSDGYKFNVNEPGTGKSVQFLINHDTISGDVNFGPLGASTWIGIGRELTVDQNQIPRRGIAASQYYASEVHEFNAPIILEPRYRDEVLFVPETLRSLIDDLIEREFEARSKAQERVLEVEKFFQDNFAYSEVSPKSRTMDPVAYFLQSRHAAHCEYFATAACLLLRQSGIPARYVTGFVVAESDNDQEGRWLARNRDAHAWVEAYIEDQKRWVLVEATPGRTAMLPDFEESERGEQNQSEKADSGGEDQRNNLFIQWLDAVREFRITERMLWIGAVTTVVAYLIVKLLSRRAVIGIHPEVRKLDRFCRRRGLRRRKNETLESFGDRLVKSDKLRVYAKTYRQLSQEIYSPKPTET